MTDIKKGQTTNQYARSLHVFERRRSLFPSDLSSEEDSDLGHISPLHFDSDSEELHSHAQKGERLVLSKTDSIEDYDILGVVEDIQESISTPTNVKNYVHSKSISPLCISPCINVNEGTFVNETPSKISPMFKLETPHDSCNTSAKLPKLVRKSLLDSLENSLNKRKLSPYHSPEDHNNKSFKSDFKNSKVRTTLFPEGDFSLPAKSFYPKTENIMEKIQTRKIPFPKSPVNHNPARKITVRKRIGQINAGVRHKIRKPKQNRMSKISSVKTAMNSVTSSAINEYIKDLNNIKDLPKQICLIENKENTNPNIASNAIDKYTPGPKLTESNTCLNKFEVEANSSKKRALSPVIEPDPKRKFFKFSRTKGVVTVNQNVKVKVDHGKMTLIEKEKKFTSEKTNYDLSDLTMEEPLLPNIDNILSSLEPDNHDTTENNSKIVLQAHNSVSASENSILLHPQPPQSAANLILSPISQMCDVTSGLALNSPKKVKNLTSVLNKMSGEDSHVDNNFSNMQDTSHVVKQKLYPIFCLKTAVPLEKRDNKSVLTRTAKKFRNLEESQMLIDAGQKKFGVTQCPECDIVYHIGDPSDENMHLHYHNSGHILKFFGWKNEKVVADFQNNGRILQIVPGDPKIWWKKLKDLMDVINRELGCYELEFGLENSQAFLYIKNRSIAGCIVAIPMTEGYKMLTTEGHEADMCSEEKYPIKCGISRIWVAHNYRRQGIGSALMNALKKNFIYGCILDNTDIALSPPSEMGKNFATNYFKTPNYLIYF